MFYVRYYFIKFVVLLLNPVLMKTHIQPFLLAFSIFYLAFAMAACRRQVSTGNGSSGNGPEKNIFYILYKEKRQAGNTDSAMESAEIFLAEVDSGKIESGEITARLREDAAEYYENRKYSFSKAIGHLEKAVSEYRAIGMQDKAAHASYKLARLYYREGKFHISLRHISEALPVFEDTGDSAFLLDSWNLIGVLNYIYRDYSQSNMYFSRFLESAKARNDSTRYAVALNNTALYTNATLDSAKTRKLIDESIDICMKLKDSSLLCRICTNIISERLYREEFSKAAYYLDLTRPMLKTPEEYGYWYMNSGVSDMMQKDTLSATEKLSQAIRYFSMGEYYIPLQRCYQLRRELYDRTGRTDKAYSDLLSYYMLDQEMGRDDVMTELYKSQNEIISREQEEKEMIRDNLHEIIWITSASLLVIFSIIAMWIHFSRKRGQKEMREKDQMMEIMKVQRYKMDRLTDDIVSRLDKARLEIRDKTSRDRINDICAELRHSKDEGQWKEISTLIPELNSDFARKLTGRFPELTVNERRLCILLHMNLSTKEISEITRQSTQSINIARTRLRSKLGLTGRPTTIQEFLSKIK